LKVVRTFCQDQTQDQDLVFLFKAPRDQDYITGRKLTLLMSHIQEVLFIWRGVR